jgi:hypothetical protein
MKKYDTELMDEASLWAVDYDLPNDNAYDILFHFYNRRNWEDKHGFDFQLSKKDWFDIWAPAGYGTSDVYVLLRRDDTMPLTKDNCLFMKKKDL